MFKFLSSWFGAKRQATLPPVMLETPSSPAEISDTDARALDSVMPYDENLLERARTQWQFADWASLAGIEREKLQHHPDRARLALMAAAGHQGMGNHQQSRQFARLAQDWGCNRKLVARVLVSGVHDTLGRAAAIAGDESRSQSHFQHAIATGSPGNDIRLLSEGRRRQAATALGLPEGGVDGRNRLGVAASVGATTAAAALQVKPAEDGGSASQAAAKAVADASATMVKDIKQQVGQQIKQEVLNATKQLEAFMAVQSYFSTGALLPAMHGWPISPDFAQYLVELLEAGHYDAVIEFGSGTSTVLMGKTLAHLAEAHPRATPVRQLAFEHLEKFHGQTREGLTQAGLADKVELVLSPLEPYTAPDGEKFSYYSCDAALAAAAKALPPEARVLVLVDGPPGKTGKNARYPALPVVMQHFGAARLDFLMDDYIRQDEKDSFKLWMRDLDAQKRAYSTEEKPLEKGAALLRVKALEK